MSVQLSEGQTFGPRAINVTRTTLVRYAGASGDFNPIHYSCLLYTSDAADE